MQKIIVIAMLLAMSKAVKAQPKNLYAVQQPWVEKPVLHEMPEKFKNASAVYLMDSRSLVYKFEGKEFNQYTYNYRLIKVTDDKGIEMFNKVYIPFGPSVQVSDIKARVITAAGKVFDVPPGKIKEEEEDGRRYKLFALEGVDKFAEIEYSFTYKRNPVFFGSEIFHSKNVPYANARMLVVCPKHLLFAAKGYNGFKAFADSVIGDERFIAGYTENVTELEDEKYGLSDPYRQRFDFKLSYNLSKSADVEMYTWKEVAKNAYANLTTYSDKEKKAVSKFLDKINIPNSANEEAMVAAIEDFIKTNINIDEDLISEDATDLEKIVKTGNANDFGIARLFCALFDEKGIRYHPVFPSIRDQLPLDEELANWNRLDEMLINIVSTGKFLQPAGAIFRYPYVTPYWSGTRGLFLKSTSIGNMRTAVGKFDTIPMLPFEDHAHDMEVKVKLDGDTALVSSRQILKGYGAIFYRPIWAFLPKDKVDENVKDIIKNVAQSDNISNIVTENTKLTDATTGKPLIISANIKSAELIEKAGNKYLFKIGELIGTQVQMYQEKPRQLPAEVQYPHVLFRKIQFQIPDGYTVKNPDDLKIDIKQMNSEGLVSVGFVSSYTLQGQLLDVDVQETYRDLRYPLEQFEVFKNVINAAADFNKVVLVLEKKK
jgi:hypothetical protein